MVSHPNNMKKIHSFKEEMEGYDGCNAKLVPIMPNGPILHFPEPVVHVSLSSLQNLRNQVLSTTGLLILVRHRSTVLFLHNMYNPSI